MIAFYPDSKQTVPRDQNITKVCTGSIFDLLAEKDMHTVLTHSYDTISTDPLTVALFVNELNKRNVTLKLVDDAKTPQLDNYFKLSDSLDNLYTNIGRFKTKLKVRELKNDKKVTGTIPWGFKVQNDTLVPDEYEQSVTNKVIELKNQGFTCYRIAKMLNEQGFKRRVPTEWNSVYIKRILDDQQKHSHLL
jgi:DNA invertase Pin-like site-specific DNA recombinase